jgi:hypothetical protein
MLRKMRLMHSFLRGVGGSTLQFANKPPYRSAKGSHTRWFHPLLPSEPITIAGKDGDDAKLYIEREVTKKLEKLKALEEEEPEE